VVQRCPLVACSVRSERVRWPPRRHL